MYYTAEIKRNQSIAGSMNKKTASRQRLALLHYFKHASRFSKIFSFFPPFQFSRNRNDGIFHGVGNGASASLTVCFPYHLRSSIQQWRFTNQHFSFLYEFFENAQYIRAGKIRHDISLHAEV